MSFSPMGKQSGEAYCSIIRAYDPRVISEQLQMLKLTRVTCSCLGLVQRLHPV